MPVTTLILLLVPFALGIWYGRQADAGDACFNAFAWLLFLAGALAAFSFFTFSRNRQWLFPRLFSLNYSRPHALKVRIFCLALASAAFFAAGLLHYHYADARLKTDTADLQRLALHRGRHVITARVASAPLQGDKDLRFAASAMRLHESESSSRLLHGLISVTLASDSPEQFVPGDIIRFSASLRPVRNFRTPGTFDYENWWALRGITVKAFVPDALLCVRTGHDMSGGFLTGPRCLLENLRSRLMGFVTGFFAGRPEGAVASALLFGSRTGLSPALSEAFAITGTGHLLAVSGLHMALAAMLVFFSAKWCLLRFEWVALRLNVIKAATLLSMAAVVMYAGLAGFSPSATRAMVMILIFSLALIIERPHSPLNSLAAAAWILLAISPLYLFDMAFQLSFAAVFFLIIFSPVFVMPVHDMPLKQRALFYFVQVAGVSLVASLATAPLSAWYFQRISVVGPVINIVLVPLVCLLILPLLIAGVMTSLVWPALAHTFFLAPAGFLIKGMLVFIKTAAALPHAAFWIARPDTWQIALFWAALLSAGLSVSGNIRGRSRILCRALCVVLISAVVMGAVYKKYLMRTGSRFVLHVPDVGQGTCQVVELPGSRLMVMDGGGFRNSSFDTGERIVGPYIRTLGYTHIDILVLSHPETDHAGGLAALVRQFGPGELWTNSDTAPWNRAWRQLIKSVKESGTRHVVFKNSREFEQYGIRFQVLAPSGCPGTSNRNSRSLVIRLEHSNRAFLLTGDIDKRREACIVASNPGQAQVAVVPHHGSRTSSSEEFVQYVHARAAFISAGWRNYLGLPAPDVVERWRRAGALVLTTAHDGTLTASFSGHGLVIDTWDHNRRAVRNLQLMEENQ